MIYVYSMTSRSIVKAKPVTIVGSKPIHRVPALRLVS